MRAYEENIPSEEIDQIPGITVAHSFLNRKPDSRKTRLQDSRILSLGPMSTILKPAVAISLTSVCLHRSFATFPLANSNSSSNDAPARSGSPENADSPGVTLITAVDPGTSDGMAPDSPFDPKTWIRVPELPASMMIPNRRGGGGLREAAARYTSTTKTTDEAIESHRLRLWGFWAEDGFLAGNEKKRAAGGRVGNFGASMMVTTNQGSGGGGRRQI